MGLIGPAGLDGRVVDLLSREVHKALTAEELKRLFAANGFDVVASTPEEFSAFIRSEYQSWGEFIQARGIHGE